MCACETAGERGISSPHRFCNRFLTSFRKEFQLGSIFSIPPAHTRVYRTAGTTRDTIDRSREAWPVMFSHVGTGARLPFVRARRLGGLAETITYFARPHVRIRMTKIMAKTAPLSPPLFLVGFFILFFKTFLLKVV